MVVGLRTGSDCSIVLSSHCHISMTTTEGECEMKRFAALLVIIAFALITPALALADGFSVVGGLQGQVQGTAAEQGQARLSTGGTGSATQTQIGGNVQDQTIGKGSTRVSFSNGGGGGCERECNNEGGPSVQNSGYARGLTNVQSEGYFQTQTSKSRGTGVVLQGQEQSQGQRQGQVSGFLRIRGLER